MSKDWCEAGITDIYVSLGYPWNVLVPKKECHRPSGLKRKKQTESLIWNEKSPLGKPVLIRNRSPIGYRCCPSAENPGEATGKNTRSQPPQKFLSRQSRKRRKSPPLESSKKMGTSNSSQKCLSKQGLLPGARMDYPAAEMNRKFGCRILCVVCVNDCLCYMMAIYCVWTPWSSPTLGRRRIEMRQVQ